MLITIFLCYAREDEALLNKLKTHLRPLQRQSLIDVWYDREISAGTEWEQEIKEHLNTARVILLLVSPDFMNSDYCYSTEMKRALERHERGEARVIPIILRPVFWHGKPLGKLQALPTDGKPVTDPDWHNQDRAFYDITQGIYQVIKQLAVLRTLTGHTPVPVEKLAVLRTLTGHTDPVESVAISPDGQRLFSGSWDTMIREWDLFTGKEVCTLTGHTDPVTYIEISLDGQHLFSESWNGHDELTTFKKWDLFIGKEVSTYSSGTAPTHNIVTSPDGQTFIIAGGKDTAITVLAGKKRTLTGHTGPVMCITISPDGQHLFSGSWDTTIKVWDVFTGKEIRTLTGHAGPVTCITISPDGQWLFSASTDKTIKVWGE